MEPFNDTEWVERNRDWIFSPSETASDEVLGTHYRRVQAQWMLDHLKELEEVAPELAAYIKETLGRSHER